MACEPMTKIGLGAALRLRLRRHRIHLGGIDEIDAVRDGVVQLRIGIGLRVLLAPCHRAEADLGDAEFRAGKRSVFHGDSVVASENYPPV